MSKSDETAKHLIDRCYEHILPHMKRYRDETDPYACLKLMAPAPFAGFGKQSHWCISAAVISYARADYQQAVAIIGTAYLDPEHWQPDAHAIGEVHRCLAPCLAGFTSTLAAYATIYREFGEAIAAFRGAAWQEGVAISQIAGEIGHDLFGTVGRVIFTGVVGYGAGSRAAKHLKAVTAELDASFHAMLAAYDNAMTNLCNNALRLLQDYRAQLQAAMHFPLTSHLSNEYHAEN